MCWSSLLVECLVEERLAEARAAAAQRSLLRSLPRLGQRQGGPTSAPGIEGRYGCAGAPRTLGGMGAMSGPLIFLITLGPEADGQAGDQLASADPTEIEVRRCTRQRMDSVRARGLAEHEQSVPPGSCRRIPSWGAGIVGKGIPFAVEGSSTSRCRCAGRCSPTPACRGEKTSVL